MIKAGLQVQQAVFIQTKYSTNGVMQMKMMGKRPGREINRTLKISLNKKNSKLK